MTANPITAWSFSRLALYEQCPLKFKYKHIDKLEEETSPAMARGRKVHEAAAAYVEGKAPMPKEAVNFSGLMGELRDMPPEIRVVEQQWGFTKNWRATGWFGKTTWLRVILDAGVVYPDGTADVVDFKTGKRYGENHDQMELFALATMCRYPQTSDVTTRLWYLDSGEEDVAEFSQENKSEMIEKWEKRVEPLFHDTVFAPRPNDKCRFCSFSKSKGGPCRFG